MYSGTTLTKYSGCVIGAHQKLDRVARKHLDKLLTEDNLFPSSRKILHFEGKNGPDGIKRKSPSQDEPWHFYDPSDKQDTRLIKLMQAHYQQLVKELKGGNQERSAFEAAWLAHTIVDGLTPAHHYPYEEKLMELRGGASNETRTSLKAKLVMPGLNRRDQVKNNWHMWGPKGLMLTHALFEFGIATLIAPLSIADAVPTTDDIRNVQKIGITEWFKRAAMTIDDLQMYDKYYQKGWTPRLAYQVRHQLAPVIAQTVTLAWYMAMVEAELVTPPEIV